MRINVRRRTAVLTGAALATLTTATVLAATTSSGVASPTPDRSAQTASPIKHLVVIFDENVSYDHYFGTYPKAANTDGTTFYATTSTPRNNNLVTSGLLYSNPNEYNPTRLTPAQAATCDQNHNYLPEQQAFNDGAMNQFVQHVSVDSCSGLYGAPGLTMDYYDGNTVTGLWNYAQQYALSDNSYGTGFGPSTPGALNLISGNTWGVTPVTSVTHDKTTDSYVAVHTDSNGVGTVINDPDPAYDDCADKNHTSTNNLAEMSGQNVGDVLNARGVSWGWFQGGFAPTTSAADSPSGFAICGAAHNNITGASVVDYSPHHDPFEYYASTANPHHTAPASLDEIGHNGQANHQYDMSYFAQAVAANKMPAVSFLKAPEYQDGHAAYSDPLDEQNFLVNTINTLEKSKEWASTAVVIAYDDSDGWYDHAVAPINNAAHDAANNDSICTSSTAPMYGDYEDRCGPGPRLPLLVISPYAKTNFIAHNETTQTSVLRFIEQNWFTGTIGNASLESRGGTLSTMFDFTQSNNKRVILNPNGSVHSIRPITNGRPTAITPVVTH